VGSSSEPKGPGPARSSTAVNVSPQSPARQRTSARSLTPWATSSPARTGRGPDSLTRAYHAAAGSTRRRPSWWPSPTLALRPEQIRPVALPVSKSALRTYQANRGQTTPQRIVKPLAQLGRPPPPTRFHAPNGFAKSRTRPARPPPGSPTLLPRCHLARSTSSNMPVAPPVLSTT
jgi:hypothetical protein